MNIYVGNLAYSTTENDLRKLFEEFGEVSTATLIKDKISGKSKGFGFIEMPSNAEAETAIRELNDKPVTGRKIKVNQAKPRTENRQQRRPRY
ncbi:RNA-binding protein [Endozoicomonas sp. SM1973]|uniref:RNA-binding protein n=1 Tax=Spartinivicinus marinus TaxID=2994442 RepID=A0A853IC86_9GAMM|nr:RNA-binding protein [Spartinivicinus marinus]MCX4026443.1 RNA-binding protein [Spartinivicinus marinus]NYZ66815.1 RNA-binding protein [Spartinivicinus marinus]